MFILLMFSQMVVKKLVDDQGMYSHEILGSLSDNDIVSICNMFRRPGGLLSEQMHDKGDQISILMEKYLKHAACAFKMMKCCSRPYGIKSVSKRKV